MSIELAIGNTNFSYLYGNLRVNVDLGFFCIVDEVPWP